VVLALQQPLVPVVVEAVHGQGVELLQPQRLCVLAFLVLFGDNFLGV